MPVSPQNLRVVVFEREPIILLDLVQQFEAAGASVTAYAGAATELDDKLRGDALSFNAAVLDIDAPPADLQPLLTAVTTSRAALALTGARTGGAMNAAEAPFFSKPVSFETLLANLCEQVDVRSGGK
jgi:CheY-like chemotaxis protein